MCLVCTLESWQLVLFPLGRSVLLTSMSVPLGALANNTIPAFNGETFVSLPVAISWGGVFPPRRGPRLPP